MSTRKGRGMMAPAAPVRNKKTPSVDIAEQSTIDSAIFIEGLQQKNGNALHSTAIEEDLNQSKETRAAKSRVGKRVKEGVQTRPLTNEQAKVEKSGSANRRSSDLQKEPDAGARPKKRQNNVLSSDEDTDEDTSWVNPSAKKAKSKSLERSQKKLSTVEVRRDEKTRKRSRGRTELEVVMEAFLNFCDEYRDSVESTAVKQSIDCFSNNVKEQLLEKVTSYSELKVLKRENAKVCAMIGKRTQKLFDTKSELIRAERQLGLLQKMIAELKLRLEDLRRSQAFLKDVRELNKVYLDYRTAHPKEEETYGACSLPTLIQGTKVFKKHKTNRVVNKKKKLKRNGK
ncbi:uncharacterized protein cenpu isoform X2 [Festucalex cinctus]